MVFGRSRLSPGGLFLFLFLALALLVPILWLNTDHPLAMQEDINLCELIRPGIGDLFPTDNVSLDTKIPGYGSSPANCGIYLSSGELLLGASVMTRKSLFGNAMGHADTQTFWEQSVDEFSVDKNQLSPVDGSWNKAVSIHNPRAPAKLQLYIEDYGIIASISSERLDEKQLTDFAQRLLQELRRQ